jgi:hypothetical protein
MMLALLLAFLVEAPTGGRPLFYWGARRPVITAPAVATGGVEAQVVEVHATQDKGDLVLRFTLDRPVHDAIRLPDGSPISGRLRAVLYVDADGDRRTGWDQGPNDLRTGADGRLDLGAVSIGEDPEEKRPAGVVVSATLYSLTIEGRRRTLWRADDDSEPNRVSAHDECVELRVPTDALRISPRARLILATADGPHDGRLVP